jgi:hypothetical protein
MEYADTPTAPRAAALDSPAARPCPQATPKARLQLLEVGIVLEAVFFEQRP